MKAFGGGGVEIHVFLSSALDGGEWLASRPLTIINLDIFRSLSFRNCYEALLSASSQEIRTVLILDLGELKNKNMMFCNHELEV
jgi:hypothetical protein